MRHFLFIFILSLAAHVSAQSSAVMTPFEEGTRLSKAGDYDKARVSFKSALSASLGENASFAILSRLHYNLGVCEYKLGKTDEAVNEFDQAIELRSGDYAKASFALGRAHLDLEHWTDAEDALLSVIRHDSKNAEAWFDLAFAYLGQSDLVHAEMAFRSAIALKSVDTAWAHNNLGVILAAKGDLAGAEKEFNAALKASGGELTEARGNLDILRSHPGWRPVGNGRDGLAFLGKIRSTF